MTNQNFFGSADTVSIIISCLEIQDLKDFALVCKKTHEYVKTFCRKNNIELSKPSMQTIGDGSIISCSAIDAHRELYRSPNLKYIIRTSRYFDRILDMSPRPLVSIVSGGQSRGGCVKYIEPFHGNVLAITYFKNNENIVSSCLFYYPYAAYYEGTNTRYILSPEKNWKAHHTEMRILYERSSESFKVALHKFKEEDLHRIIQYEILTLS